MTQEMKYHINNVMLISHEIAFILLIFVHTPLSLFSSLFHIIFNLSPNIINDWRHT